MGFIKKFFLFTGLSILLLMVSVAGLTFLFQDKLKALAIETLNAHVATPIKVANGIDISFLRSFPKIDIGFKSVTIQDPLRPKKSVLDVKRLSLLVNIYELFSPTISIQQIVVSDGKISLYKNTNGQSNFEILKVSKGESSPLKLNAVKIQNVLLSWDDRANATFFDGKVNKVIFKGDFKQASFDMELKADFWANRFIIKTDTLQLQKNAVVSVEMGVNKANKQVQIKPSSLSIGDNLFKLSGQFGYAKSNNALAFNATCAGAEMSSLLDLLPTAYQQKLQGAKGKGAYAIKLAYKKSTNGKQIFDLDILLKNATVSLPQVPKAIEKINTHILYNSEKDRLAVANFSSVYDGKPVSFSLSASDISTNGAFQLSANGIANLTALEKFLPNENVSDLKGEIAFNDFKLHGLFKKGGVPIANTLEGSGSFSIHQASLKADGVVYENINGKLSYKNGHLEAQDLSAKFLASDFLFSGTIDNLLPYIVEKVKREGTTQLNVDGHLTIQKFDLTAILATFDKQEKNNKAEKINIRDIFAIAGNLELKVGEFIYKKIMFKDILADLQLANGLINIRDFGCRTMGGRIQHVGFIKFTERDELQVSGDLSIRQLEITQLFEQAENFGQKTLTSKNVKGKIDATVSFNSYFTNYKDIDLKRLTATAQCQILNGELLNFEALKVASKFIRVEELEHIYFSDLSNELIIKNGVITIPQMEIQSNAVNLNMQGTHTFENQINYHLKINLRKLLANKFRKNNSTLYIEEDPYEGTNILLNIKGDIKSPKVSYDNVSANQKIKDDFKKEKENLKTLFKKDAQQPHKEDIKEEKYFNTQEKPTFIDFGDE